VEILTADNEPEEAIQGVKRKKVAGDDGAGTSKRRRHLITVDVSSSEDASSSISVQEIAETTPPK
jgi:hypothetical protein